MPNPTPTEGEGHMDDRTLETKTFGPLEVKDETKGEVVAVVATLGVVDHDGDVILPGAIPPGGAKVKLSGYNHDVVFDGAAPVGKGTITEEGERAVFRGRFFMSTDRGREAFHTVKELGDEGEWSFGFPRAVQAAEMTDEWRAKGAKRLIAGMQPMEASPVFRGAGIGTQTVMAKSETPQEPPPDLAAEEARVLQAKRDAEEVQRQQGILAESIARFERTRRRLGA